MLSLFIFIVTDRRGQKVKANSAEFIKRSKVLLILTLLAVVVFQLIFTVQPAIGNGNVTPDQGFQYFAAPRTVTVGSADITSTTAITTGNLTAFGTANEAKVFFKYGKTWNQTIYPSWAGGNTTPGQEMKEVGIFSANLSGLEPGTTYYFRAVAKGEGTFLGNCMTFVTSTGTE